MQTPARFTFQYVIITKSSRWRFIYLICLLSLLLGSVTTSAGGTRPSGGGCVHGAKWKTLLLKNPAHIFPLQKQPLAELVYAPALNSPC